MTHSDAIRRAWVTRRALGGNREALKQQRAFTKAAWEKRARRANKCLACGKQKARRDRKHWYCADCRATYAAKQRMRKAAA